MAAIDLGDNYRLEEDEAGDLVVRDVSAGTVVARHGREADVWSFSGVAADRFNADVLVPDATGPAIQAAFDAASPGAVVRTFGDVSLTSALRLDRRLHWIHHGDLAVRAGAAAGIQLGHDGPFQNFSVVVRGNIHGDGPDDGASAIDVRAANAGFIACGRVARIQRGFRFEGRGDGVGPLDNTVVTHKVEGVTKGIELFANGHIVQGMVFRNFPIFDAERAIHVHTAAGATRDRATLNYFDGVTVHGSTDPVRNTHEILEEGNNTTSSGSLEGNTYHLKFLPGDSSRTSLYGASRLAAPNRPSLPYGGVVGDTVYAYPEWFATVQAAIDHAEAGRYRRVVVPPGAYEAVMIAAPLAVVGLGPSSGGGPGAAAIFDGGVSSHGITVASNDVVLRNLQAKTAGGGDLDAFHTGSSIAVRIVDCTVDRAARHGLFVNGDWVQVRGVLVKGATGGSGIELGPDTANCVVEGNVADVTDRGAPSNAVGHNAG